MISCLTTEETKKRKRTSFVSVISQGLKRKREEEEEEEVIEVKRPRNNPVINLIQRVIKPRKTIARPPQEVFINLLDNFVLPTIEWTGGDLGILEKDDDFVLCLDALEYFEFPKPPSYRRSSSYCPSNMLRDTSSLITPPDSMLLD